MANNSSEYIMTTAVSEEEVDIGNVSSQLIAFLFIGAFGIVSNGFALVVFVRSKSMRTKHANQFIISQSCIDMITAFFMVVNFPTAALDVPNPPGTAGSLFCKIAYLISIFNS